MRLIGVSIVMYLKIFAAENVMIPFSSSSSVAILQQEEPDDRNLYHPSGIIGLRDLPITTVRYEDYEEGSAELTFPVLKTNENEKPEPCSMMVLSNSQSSVMQSLLRKYRYDANGILIPSSVKYYLKIPQGFGSAPILVPLTGKAFTPLGGFVRYYKEVPPIPPTL